MTESIKTGDIRNITGEVVIATGNVTKKYLNFIQRPLTTFEEADKQREIERTHLAGGVVQVVQRLHDLANQDIGKGGPYKGLSAYHLNEADIFQGRQGAITQMLKCMCCDSLTILQAESGAGKTSLLQAGIAPRLIAQGDLVALLRSNKRDPIDCIKGHFLADLSNTPGLQKAPLREFLRQILLPGSKNTLYVFLDQFEEFFNYFSKEDRKPFLEALAECLNDTSLRVRWVIALRTETFGALHELTEFGIHPFNNEYCLNRLNRNEAQDAIIEPAKRHRLTFERELVTVILDELERNLYDAHIDIKDEKSGIVPTHLQLVCAALVARNLSTTQTVTLEQYQELGGAKGILKDYLKNKIDELPPEERIIAWKVLHLLVTSDGHRAICKHDEIVEQICKDGITKEQLDTVLKDLFELRLVSTQREIVDTFELTHDYLVEKIEISPEEKARKAAQELLDQEVRAYQRYKTLLTPERLAVIEPHQAELVFSADAGTLFSESRKARLKRERRRKTITTGVIAIAVLIAIIMGFLAKNANDQTTIAQAKSTLAIANESTANAERIRAIANGAIAQANGEEAQRQATNRIAEGLAAYSVNQSSREYDLGLLLGLEANRQLDNNKTRASIMTILNSNPYLYQFIHIDDGWVKSVAFDSEGKTLAAGGNSGIVTLWSPSYPSFQEYAPLKRDDAQSQYVAVEKIAFKPPINNENVIAIGYSDGRIMLWEYTKPFSLPLQTLINDDYSISALAFNPNGEFMASASESGQVCLWDIQAAVPTCKPLVNAGGKVWQLIFSSNNVLVGAGGESNSIFIWDITTGNLITQKANANETTIYSLAVDSSGSIIATGDYDSKIKIWRWDGVNLNEVQTLEGANAHSYWVISLKFIPVQDSYGNQIGSGDWLVSGSGDHDMILWRHNTDENEYYYSFVQKLHAHSGFVLDIAYDPNNKWIASAGSDGKVILWNPPCTTSGLGAQICGLESPIIAANSKDAIYAISSHHSVYIYSSDNSVLCDSFEISTTESTINVMAFQPKNRSSHLIAVGLNNGLIELHDLQKKDCSQIGLLDLGGFVRDLAFDYSGIYLASARESKDSGDVDSNAIIWDISNPQKPQIHQELLTFDLTTSTSMPVRAIAFSPTASLLAYLIGSGDQSMIVIWDTKTAKQQKILGNYDDIHRHNNNIWSLAFSPDGKLLASASGDTYVKLWDVATRKFVVDFTGHKNGVLDVDFSPDGSTLASIGRDGKLFLWDVEKKQILAQLDTSFDLSNVGFLRTYFLENGNILTSDGSSTEITWDMDSQNWRLLACEVANRNLSDSEKQAYSLNESNKTCPSSDAGTQMSIGVLSGLKNDPTTANSAFAAAAADAEASKDATIENNVCWIGSLSGYAKAVMSACDDMIKVESGNQDIANYSDTRAVARALAGDFTGAITDEEVFINAYQNDSEYACFVDRRKGWVDKLRKGLNPFDAATLEYLRFEILDPGKCSN